MNTYFRFRQFTIHQEHCAMKVSTDACIQGAWTPVAPQVAHVLDVGTGTGLLSLMLAQRNTSIEIDAIELDERAATQAQENAAASQWHSRINMIHGDARTHNFRHQYDMIISNPPFFHNGLLGDLQARNMARHTMALSHDELFQCIKNNLKDTGYASVMLPPAEHALWQDILKRNGWSIIQKLIVRSKETTAPVRIISVCSLQYVPFTEEHLIIRNADNTYSAAFNDLLKPFYLLL